MRRGDIHPTRRPFNQNSSQDFPYHDHHQSPPSLHTRALPPSTSMHHQTELPLIVTERATLLEMTLQTELPSFPGEQTRSGLNVDTKHLLAMSIRSRIQGEGIYQRVGALGKRTGKG